MATEEADGGTADPNDKPVEIEELDQHVDHVVSNFLFDPDDMKTVSVVVRDEDGEIVGESYPQPRSGVWALTRVVREPENPDAYRFDRADPPEWIEWVFDDPPLDHFVVGIRCTECGETNDHVLRKTTDVVSEFEWERLRHKGTCDHASEKDRDTWPDRKRAREIKSRPHPRTMALGCIWRESDELQDLLEEGEWTHEAAQDRLRTMASVLEGRLDASYPDCSECGQRIRQMERGYASCHAHCGDLAAIREYWRHFFRVWGRRGHGGHGPFDGGEPADE